MKEFLKTNTVTYNLMSFTGFKSILLFLYLLDGPKSYEEMQNYLKNNEYLHEVVSIDTLRVYLNSLKEIGCKISKVSKGKTTRFAIDSHPFTLKVSDKHVKSIIKINNAISKNIEVTDFQAIQNFLDKFSACITNKDLKEELKNTSPLNNIDKNLISDLITYTQNKNEITIYYNSLNSGKKNITIKLDKIYINNNKLYISGINYENKSYASFLVSKIINIVSVNLHTENIEVPILTVGYEYSKDSHEDFDLLENEKIISSNDNKLLIEITSQNKFNITQRIMSHGSKCKVLYPTEFKNHIISTLKQMKEGYCE